ncbi:MAG TPA: D-glucuronyl C5-epimerase family protein [Candidatus Baltobacteraceae bacterium]|nr:D-glucuronyl C5-epimerase family protein [Candidatus Baltobacteraceae bacterium]
MTNTLNRAAVAFPLNWQHCRPYRAYERAERLGPYYVRWDADGGPYGEGWAGERFDAQGVLISGKERAYHPIRIAQFALEQFGRWRERGDVAARRAFLAQSRWFLEHQHVRRNIPGCYPFPFAWPRYGAPAGFLSAMAQGEAISVLLRAAQTTQSDIYLHAAVRAAQPFRHAIGEGGVSWTAPRGDLIFEEAATQNAAHILNGWIFAAWGLFELRSYASWAGDLFDRSMETLLERLPLYDSGRWSYYSLAMERGGFRRLATLKYHAFHVAQLHVLASMTGHTAFEDTACRWQSYTRRIDSRAALWSNSCRAALREKSGAE